MKMATLNLHNRNTYQRQFIKLPKNSRILFAGKRSWILILRVFRSMIVCLYFLQNFTLGWFRCRSFILRGHVDLPTLGGKGNGKLPYLK